MNLDEIKNLDKIKQLAKNKDSLLNKIEINEGQNREAVVKYNRFVKEFSIRVEPSISTLLFSNKSLVAQLNNMVCNFCPIFSNLAKLILSEVDTIKGGIELVPMLETKKFEEEYGGKIQKAMK